MPDEWTWTFTPRAREALRELDASTQERVIDKLDDVVDDEFRDPPGFAKPLTGMKPWQSIRVGDYRIIGRFDGDELVVYVGTVGHRSSVYDDFP